jgi:hypothetical protein
MTTARPRCSRCGVLAVPLPGDVCGPCKLSDLQAEENIRADLAACQR